MVSWQDFAAAVPDIAIAGTRLLQANEVAFIATVAASGRPRIHPFVPKIVEGRLVAFIMDSSPKIIDLRQRGDYALHMLPGEDDEEFFIGGSTLELAAEDGFRISAGTAMGFATGIDDHHVQFELLIDRALWTRWLDFGTADHRPCRSTWVAPGGR